MSLFIIMKTDILLAVEVTRLQFLDIAHATRTWNKAVGAPQKGSFSGFRLTKV